MAKTVVQLTMLSLSIRTVVTVSEDENGGNTMRSTADAKARIHDAGLGFHRRVVVR